jgi:hypothetical protein
MATRELVSEPTTTPATEPSAQPDFSVNWAVVGSAIEGVAADAVSRYAMTSDDLPEKSMALSKAIVQGKVEAAQVAKVWLAGLPESYPQVVGVVNCCRYEQRLTIGDMSVAERHELLAVKAAEHIAALPLADNDMAFYLSSNWEKIALKLVD